MLAALGVEGQAHEAAVARTAEASGELFARRILTARP